MPSFALLKGWRNYLCLARLNQAVGSQRTLLEQDKLDELISRRIDLEDVNDAFRAMEAGEVARTVINY